MTIHVNRDDLYVWFGHNTPNQPNKMKHAWLIIAHIFNKCYTNKIPIKPNNCKAIIWCRQFTYNVEYCHWSPLFISQMHLRHFFSYRKKNRLQPIFCHKWIPVAVSPCLIEPNHPNEWHKVKTYRCVHGMTSSNKR